LSYKKGGVESGFRHVESNVYNILRLLHVKGSKHVTATEVEVSWSSFNSGDIFLLDMGKAVLLAQDIRDRERGGRAQIGVVEGGDEEDSPELMKIMRAVLGQRSGKLKEAEPDDTPDHQQQTANIRLYNVSDNSGKLVVQEIAMQPLTQDLLHSTDCYIVDQGGSSVLVWKGKESSSEERRSALSRAVGFIKAKNYSSSTNVEVMAEGGESAMFKHLFISWRENGQTKGLGNVYSTGKIAKVEQVKFDVMELHARPELAAQQRMIWRIEDLELRELHPSSFGQFYGGDCYLLLYTYKRANKLQYILYMWQGRHATKDEITACAYQAVALDNKYSGAPVQVRVVMGKEPRHFLAIFKGKLIIFEGGTGRAGVTGPGPGARLFQVRGTNELNTKATEVPARSSSLNTNDVFLLKTDHIIYMWYGKKEEPTHSPRLFECSNQTGRFRMTEVQDLAQEDLDQDDVMLLDTWEEIFLWIGRSANEYETKEACNSALEYLRNHPAGRDPDTPIISVKQGYEPPTFTGWFSAWDPHKWSGGSSYEEMKQKLGDVSTISQITVNLNNTDLNQGSAGGGSGYSAPGGPAQFSSPPSYKPPLGTGGGSFGPSSPATPGGQKCLSTNFSTTLSPTLSSPSLVPSTTPAPRTGEYLDPELLLNKSPKELPQGVDPSRREDYLSDVDLENLLGCSRSGFQRLPKWRQNDLKKKAGLF
ncbi:unnamed protein product, partial [Coregonus sp. 'balchen']